ncbi:MAG: alpha/beta hydrolase, partial [Pseudonocardiales bacterium]|nr:alpha/beta hydrolase [Pseudonocardiales bacterium]
LSANWPGPGLAKVALKSMRTVIPRLPVKSVRPPFRAPGRVRPSGSAPTARLAGRAEVGTPDTHRQPWPGRHHDVDGADVFVRTTPFEPSPPFDRNPSPNSDSGEPALYVHGLGGASTNFTDLAALLSPWLAAEAIDLPAFGRSGPSATNSYSIASHAQVVTSYLQQSDRGPVHLVGNSMGGAVSILIAARNPELVRTLTLISPAVPDLRPKKAEDLLLPLLLVPRVGPRMMRTLDRHDAQSRARAVIDICFAHPELVPANRLAEAVADVEWRRGLPWANEAFLGSFRGIAGNYLSWGGRSPWRTMAVITAPTLVVWGALDRLVDVSRAPRVAATIPGASLLVLPDVGHTAQLEDPVTTARSILALIRPSNRAVAAPNMPS